MYAAICCKAGEYPMMIEEIKRRNIDVIPGFIIDIDDFGKNEHEANDALYEKCNNLFYRTETPPDMELISCEDAKFLYLEGRINLVVFSDSLGKQIIDNVKKELGLT